VTGQPRSLLRQRDFRLLWAGQGVSEFGSAITMVALPLAAVVTLNASPLQVGLLDAATTAAFLLVGLPAGALVDRRRRRPVLMRADLGRALLFGSIPVAAAFGVLTLAQLFVVALFGGLLRVFFDVAYQSYLPALVARDQLVQGNSTLMATEATAQVAGPGVGGALVGAIGAAATMTIDAVSYLVSFVSLALIRRPEPPVEVPEGGHLPLRQAVREGLAFVIRQPMLLRIAGCTAISNLSSGIAFALQSVFMIRTLHMTPALVGLVFAVMSVGSVLGALSAGAVTRRLGVGPAIIFGAVLSASGPLVWPLATVAHPLPWLMVGGVLLGLGVPIYNVTQVSLRQAITPQRLLGRMNASIRFVVWGVSPIGGVIGGVLGALVGVRNTVLIGALIGIPAVPWIVFSPIRRLRVVPDPLTD
jgi:MFS family permease